MSQLGAKTAFRRKLTFSETDVLTVLLPYLKKTLQLAGAEVLTVDEARKSEGQPGFSKGIIDTSEPGAPAFEYRNT